MSIFQSGLSMNKINKLGRDVLHWRGTADFQAVRKSVKVWGHRG